jgi:hypothetical protein
VTEATVPGGSEQGSAEEFVPDLTRVTAGSSDVTPELRDLLAGYGGLLETINGRPMLLWVPLVGSRLLRWVKVPAPRRLVRIFVVRHIHRCISALECAAGSRAALLGDSAAPERDLAMLQQFQRSLPSRIRLAIIWPLAMLVVLGVAYGLSAFIHANYSNLLGDLTSAALDLNRNAALKALQKAKHYADVSQTPEALLYARAAIIVASSAALVIVPFLPAFAFSRRLLARVADVEAGGFASLGARKLPEMDLDLIAWLLLLPAVALIGVYDILEYRDIKAPAAVTRSFGCAMIGLAAIAGLELRARYIARHSGAQRPPRRTSLGLATVLSLLTLIAPSLGAHKNQPWEIGLGAKGWINELNFMVTSIEQNAQCRDPLRPLKPDEQFLLFVLETWSDVDQFIDPTLATDLTLRHWSVEPKVGPSTENLYVYAKCSDGAEAISQPISPGAHTKTLIVVNAPKEAAVLQLKIPSYYGGVWRWRIPPAGNQKR